MDTPDLSIVILSWNTRELTSACLDALLRDGERPDCLTTREIIVVDNASEDGSADHIAQNYPDVVLLRNAENRLYAEGNNQGARVATGRWLCTLNSDTEVQPGALDTLVQWLQAHPEYAVASPRLVYPDGRVQHACRRFPTPMALVAESSRFGTRWPLRTALTSLGDFDHEHSRDVDQPPGAVMVVAREEYLSFGGLDPDLALFFNDVDLCLRLWKAGRRIRYVAEAVVIHHEGASTRKHLNPDLTLLWARNRATFYRKHFGVQGARMVRLALLIWTLDYALGVSLSRSKSLPEKARALKTLGEIVRLHQQAGSLGVGGAIGPPIRTK